MIYMQDREGRDAEIITEIKHVQNTRVMLPAGVRRRTQKELQTRHASAGHTCTATASDAPALPVSTNKSPSSHSGVRNHTLAKTSSYIST